MPITLQNYRIAIGLFNRYKVTKCARDLYVICALVSLAAQLGIVLAIQLLLFMCGDIELNPGPSSNNLQLCLINIQYLTKAKLLEMRNTLVGQYDIIVLCETFLSAGTKLDLHIDGYQAIERRDRPDGIGGGVAAYFSNTLSLKRRYDLEDNNVEIMCTEVSSNNRKFLLFSCYRPPNRQTCFWEYFQDIIDKARLDNVKSIIITGDLNSDKNTQPQNHAAMTSFTNANSLYIHVNQPTRITSTSASVLDQFISNIPDFVKEVEISDAPLLTNDHLTVFATLKFRIIGEKAYDRHIWLYDRADWAGYRHALDTTDWDTVFVSDDANDVCKRLSESIINIARQFIPNKVVKIRPKDAPFYNNELRKLKRQVIRKYRKAKNHAHNEYYWEKYRELRNRYVAAVREAKELHDMRLANSLRESRNLNPRRWWHTTKLLMGQNKQSQYPPIHTTDNEISDPTEKA